MNWRSMSKFLYLVLLFDEERQCHGDGVATGCYLLAKVNADLSVC